MRILIAVDSFKGSLGSAEAGAMIAAGLETGLAALNLPADIAVVPTADGGEGTVEAFAAACGGERIPVRASGPLGDPVSASVLLLPNRKTMIIESAQTCGLPLVSGREDILRSETSGLGRMIRAALDRNPERIWIGLGGSATNDWGAGLAAEMGVRFLDGSGRPLRPRPLDLSGIRSVDLGGLDGRVRGVRFTALADVDNPLLGPRGAAAVFAPQKGADADTVGHLEETGVRYAEAVETALGRSFRDRSGAGAAGGLGFALLAFLGADIRPGIEALIEAAGLAAKAEQADLIITGEGRLDAQSRRGKTAYGIAALAQKSGRPCVAFCGAIAGPVSDFIPDPFAAGYSILPEAGSVAEAKARAGQYLELIARRAVRELSALALRP
ncbi:MAG: glycerate kinase [Candidatus Aminicenantes bacterium]|nr:glycerate kinase [Candidatus Aminicenantes bacterium]